MAQTTIQGSFLGDGTVTGVKIGADFISAQTVLSSGLATADELIVSDAGVIKKIAMSVWAAATITLTNKSIDLGTNTLTGSIAEFNTALQSESFATLGGTETLVAKTLTTPTISSTGWTNALHAHAANNSGGTLSASILGAGTIPDGRFPSTLPALVGTALTALDASNLSTGTIPAARIAADSIVEGKFNVSNGPTNGYVLTARDGVAGGFTWEAAAAGGIASVVADTTPQLGGNLDMQARLLVGNAGSTGIAISANGEVTMAAQPAFLATNQTEDANTTGDGTLANVDFDTEIFDQNADFASDTFTAPVTGRYALFAHVMIHGITSTADQMTVWLTTSNRTYIFELTYTDTIGASTTQEVNGLFDMDAADTAIVQAKVPGQAEGRTADIRGDSSNMLTFYSGYLVA